jgi:hypothetical protein
MHVPPCAVSFMGETMEKKTDMDWPPSMHNIFSEFYFFEGRTVIFTLIHYHP